MLPPNSSSKEYNVSVSTDDIHEAIGSLSSALYALVEEALTQHENHEAEECEFEVFARDLLGVLTRHAEQFSDAGTTWDTDEDEDSEQYA